MTLFTKKDCQKCDYIKEKFDLEAMGIQIDVLDPDDANALAHLAWHELVPLAESQLPILVLDNGSHIAGAVAIKKYLEGRGLK